MAGKGKQKKKSVPPPTPPRGAAGPSRTAAVSAAGGPTPFGGPRRITRQRTSSGGCPSGIDSQDFRDMLEHVREDVEYNKERYSARRKGKAAARPAEETAPAASGSVTSGAQQAHTPPDDPIDPAVQPSLYKLQQQHDQRRAQLARKKAELAKMEEEYQAADKELTQLAKGGKEAPSPGGNPTGAATATGAATGAPKTGTPTAAPAGGSGGMLERGSAGENPRSIALRQPDPT